ncbi:hypothetical protein MHU86_15345 [Fragilaria crotonensis]|nr:hypothetical protein MHU86_15345 [Fragilaria crotonensis]
MGGQWINIGPLQWHTNAHLQPAADELKKLIPIFGFRINHWSIDTKPVDYRFEDPTRSTKYEGYQPLRMVATKIKQRRSRYRVETSAPSRAGEQRQSSSTVCTIYGYDRRVVNEYPNN